MATVAHITLRKDEAVKLARETDTRTCDDIGYVAKDSLGEAFGDQVIRPYRLIIDDDRIRVLGYSANHTLPRSSPTGLKTVADVVVSQWGAEKGSIHEMDVIACPLEDTRTAEGKSTQRDVGKSPKFNNPVAAYDAWLRKQFANPNSGCLLDGMIRFTDIGRFPALRKNTAADTPGNAVKIWMPHIRAIVRLRIVNPHAFDRFVMTGIGKQRAFGYGSIFPAEILKEFETI